MVRAAVIETSSPSPERDAAGRRRARRRRAVGAIVLGLLAALVLTLAALYAARRALAREALVGWLESRGVDAEVSFESLGPRGLVGDLRIGPAEAPIVSADHAEVAYRLTGPWAGEAFGLEVRSVRLRAPTVRAALEDDGLSFGALDPIIAEFRARPPRPEAQPPEIIVENAVVHLRHAAGVAHIRASAAYREGQLRQLSAQVGETALAGEGFSAEVGAARLGLVTRDDRVSFSLVAELEEGAWGDRRVAQSRLNLAGSAPYPDLGGQVLEGPVRIVASLRGGSISTPEGTAKDLVLAGGFRGDVGGWREGVRLSGAVDAALTSQTAAVAGLDLSGARLAIRSDRLTWNTRGAGALQGPLRLSLTAGRAALGDLSLRDVSARLTGQAHAAEGLVRAELSGPVSGRGSWSALGPPAAGDPEELAAIKRAAADFVLTAPQVQVRHDAEGLVLALGEPAVARTAGGGRLIVRPRGGAPLFGGGGGALELSMEGGGLPQIAADVRRYSTGPGGLEATLALQAAASFGPLREMETTVEGVLRAGESGLTLAASGCAPFEMERLEAGENSVEDLAARLCPAGEPLVRIADGQWRLAADVEGARAEIPFLQAKAQGAEGRLRVGSAAEGLRLEAQVDQARLVDASPTTRFHPLAVSGAASLRDELWRGELQLSTPAGARVAQVSLRHDEAAGAGGVAIDTDRLTFREGGLQPADLSPLAEPLGAPVFGEARFSGTFDWTGTGADSAGLLEIFGLDFRSPAGALEGLKGQIAFTSLAPLETAPDQQLTAARIDSLAPLTSPQVSFQLQPDALVLEGGRLSVGGGQALLAPSRIPFSNGETWEGELTLEGVQLSDFVEGSPFADRVDLDARVSGSLPFKVTAEGLRFEEGRLSAIEPGRLSIRREALTTIDAAGGGTRAELETPGGEGAATVTEQPDTNTAVEFAYQAMEHLAFDLLDAEVNSLPGGRLGVLFHIRGEHAPPERQEIRLTLAELISRNFLNRELPLPSGTKVDLTLDTSLNLDQLLRDYVEAQESAGSAEVQAPPPD